MNKIQNKLRDLSTRQLKYILLQLHAKKNIHMYVTQKRHR